MKKHTRSASSDEKIKRRIRWLLVSTGAGHHWKSQTTLLSLFGGEDEKRLSVFMCCRIPERYDLPTGTPEQYRHSFTIRGHAWIRGSALGPTDGFFRY